MSENLQRNRTEYFISSRALVVRRGAPFRISLQLGGRPFNPTTDKLRVKVMLGNFNFYKFASFWRDVCVGFLLLFFFPPQS